jgi:hypothetical protein
VKRWLPNLRASDFINDPELYDRVLSFINSSADDYHTELFALLYKAKVEGGGKRGREHER